MCLSSFERRVTVPTWLLAIQRYRSIEHGSADIAGTWRRHPADPTPGRTTPIVVGQFVITGRSVNDAANPVKTRSHRVTTRPTTLRVS